MDNLGKALHIGVGALLFIIALTSSVILYGKIMDYVEVGLRVSDDGRRAETSDIIYGLEERTITHSEVIMSLVQIHSTNAKIIKIDTKTYSISDNLPEDKIIVNGVEKNINEYAFHLDIPNGVYTYSYSETDKTITYTKE